MTRQTDNDYLNSVEQGMFQEDYDSDEQVVYPPLHALTIHQLGVFFVKVTVAALPAAMISFAIYVSMLLLSSAFVQMVG